MKKLECLRKIEDDRLPDPMREVLASNDARGSTYRWYRLNEESEWGWEWLAYEGWLGCAKPVYWLDL